jgi:hypothetical protein
VTSENWIDCTQEGSRSPPNFDAPFTAGVSRLLSAALRQGVTLEKISTRLQLAISGSYSPHSGWLDREYDISFLVKEGYPSLSRGEGSS